MTSKGWFGIVTTVAIVLSVVPATVAARGSAPCPPGCQTHCAPMNYRFATLSFFPPISTNGCASADVRTSFALNILGGYVGALRGLELGTLFNVVAHDALGVQVVGGVNLVRCSFGGLQVAGLLNRVGQDMGGAQVALFNVTGGDVGVTQLGVVNWAGGRATTQFGLGNRAGGCTGFTLGGVNIAGGCNGVQLGGVNLVLGGRSYVQAGAVNWVRGSALLQLGGFNVASAPGETDAPWLMRGRPEHQCFVQLGGLNIAGVNTGVTVGGLNLVRGDNRVQIGAANAACGSTGFQLGGFNFARGSGERDRLGLKRVQHEKRSGFQLGGLNWAGASVGAQVSAFNIAHDVRWFQLAAFNYATRSDYPVGPLNVIRKGQFRIHASASEAAAATFEFRTGGPRFYNVLSFGYHPVETARVMLGYGVGWHIPCPCPRLFLDADAVAYRVNAADDALSLDGLSYLAKLRVTAGWQVAPPMAITGGLAANVWLSDSEDGSDIPILPIPVFNSTGDTNIGVWPGVSLGVELRVI